MIKRVESIKRMVIIFLILLTLGGFAFYKIRNFKIQEYVEFVYGPFSCSEKQLTIKTEYSVNNLEGATFLTGFTMTFGNNIVFKEIHFFEKEISEKLKTRFKFDDYNDYLEKNFSSLILPSQEELIARQYRPDSRYLIRIGTQSQVTDGEKQAFLECFKKNKDLIYDKVVKARPEGPPQALYFEKVYFLN